MASPPVVVLPTDDLRRALERFDSVGQDELPVVASDDPDRRLGSRQRRSIHRACTRQLQALRLQRDPQRGQA